MNVENPENVKCSNCRCYRSEASFYNQKGRRLKTCQICRDRDRVIRERNKCEHNRQRTHCKECEGASICQHDRQKNQCRECDGSSFCQHDRRRNHCKDCRGSSICQHDRRRNHCKDCDGASICEHNKTRIICKICSDPLKVTIRNMLTGAKQSDKKYNRYDVVNFVDYCFIKNLLEDYTHCYYEDCKRKLQILEYNDSLATIERINNNIGHVKTNCVICCLFCNKAIKSKATTE